MKMTKWILIRMVLSVVVVVMCILSLTGAANSDLVLPVALTALGILFGIRGFEPDENGNPKRPGAKAGWVCIAILVIVLAVVPIFMK